MNAFTKYAAKQHLIEKLAKKKEEKKGGHMSPGSTAMLGALFGPTGAGIGAELGRRGRATEGSPALRASGGAILGVPAGALAGALAGAGLAVSPRALKIALLKMRRGMTSKGKGKGFFKRRKQSAKRSDLKNEIDYLKGKGIYGGSPFKDRAAKGALAGGGLGALAGYFEGARRGAESVKYKGK